MWVENGVRGKNEKKKEEIMENLPGEGIKLGEIKMRYVTIKEIGMELKLKEESMYGQARGSGGTEREGRCSMR